METEQVEVKQEAAPTKSLFLVGVVVLLIALGLTFIFLYDRSQKSTEIGRVSVPPAPSAEEAGKKEQPALEALTEKAVAGKIEKVEGRVVTVKGVENWVFTATEGAEFNRIFIASPKKDQPAKPPRREAGSFGDLKVGGNITAILKMEEDGSYTASAVSIFFEE